MSQPVLPTIVRADAADANDVAHLIARNFENMAVSRWLVPDGRHRRAVLTSWFEIIVRHAIAIGHVDVLDDESGAAVWFDHTRERTAPTEYPYRRYLACGAWTRNFTTFDTLRDAHDPATPHQYLAFLVAEPQGTGRGSALLQSHLSRLDREGIPAYLEATDERNATLYHRNGFSPGTPFHLPGGPALFPMWRTSEQR